MYLRIWLVLALLALPGYALAQGFWFGFGVHDQRHQKPGPPAVIPLLTDTQGNLLTDTQGNLLTP